MAALDPTPFNVPCNEPGEIKEESLESALINAERDTKTARKSGPTDIEPWLCLAALGQVNMVFWYGQMSDHSSRLTEVISTLVMGGPLLV